MKKSQGDNSNNSSAFTSSRKSARISTRRPFHKYSSDDEPPQTQHQADIVKQEHGDSSDMGSPPGRGVGRKKRGQKSSNLPLISPPRRQRGRPRKNPIAGASANIRPYRSSDEEEEEEDGDGDLRERGHYEVDDEATEGEAVEEFEVVVKRGKKKVGRPVKGTGKRERAAKKAEFEVTQDEDDEEEGDNKYEEYEDDELGEDNEDDYVDDFYEDVDGDDFKLMPGKTTKNMMGLSAAGPKRRPSHAHEDLLGKQKRFQGSHFSKLLPSNRRGGGGNHHGQYHAPISGYLFGQRPGGGQYSGSADVSHGVLLGKDGLEDEAMFAQGYFEGHSTDFQEPHASVGVLESLLKLPKANKWILFEWFYSNLDRPLLLCDNEFRIVLRDSFPNLKTRRLTRGQWNLIRQMIGKPRRCSVAFFEEERRGLHEKRDKVRALQAKRNVDMDYLRDLPDDIHIPLPLIIGTKVNARIRDPIDTVFLGTVDALDNVNNFYRVTFDRQAYGTKSIPDYEVLSVEPHEVIPLSAFKTQHKASRNLFMSPARLLVQSSGTGGGGSSTTPSERGGGTMGSVKNDGNNMTGSGHADDVMSVKDTASVVSGSIGPGSGTSSFKTGTSSSINSIAAASSMSSAAAVASVTSALLHGTANKQNQGGPTTPNIASGVGSLLSHKLLLNESEIYGGYPMKFLVMVTRLSKILEVKKLCVEELHDFNDEVERKRSTNDIITPEFQTAYLTVIVQLERLNKELHQFMVHVLQYANEIAIEHGVDHILQTNEIRARGIEEAANMIQKVKLQNGLRVRNNKSSAFIRGLLGSLVQLRTLSENKATDVENSSIHEAIKELKQSLHASNVALFESAIEAPLEYVLSGMSNLGGLHGFHFTNPNHSHFI